MEEIIFDEYWALFAADSDFANRRAATQRLWEQCAPERRRAIIDWLKASKPKCTRNPYFFILDFRAPRQQTLSFTDYYAKYGTTEPRDGWVRTFLPEQQKTIYVKNS